MLLDWPAALPIAPEDGRKSIQGTATWRPPELEVIPDVVLLLLVVLPDVVSELPLPAPVLETFKMAKATRPEDGLMITSWMVPRDWPEELVTLEFESWLKRTCC